MSDTSDVKTLTLNTKTLFNTSAAIERVKIHNNSSFFLRVYFGSDAPISATDQGWHDTIDPGGTPLIEVVGNSAQTFTNRSYIQSTPYQGVITILPFLPVGALTASGGVIGGAALCYLTAYYPGEWASEGGEIEAFVQAAKQARYQMAGPGGVVTAPTITYDQTTAFGTLTLVDTIGGPNGALFKANQAGASVINMYLFGWGGTFRNNGPNVAGATLQPAFATTDGTGAVVRTTTAISIPHLARSVNFCTDNWAYLFPNPVIMQMSFLQGVLASGDTIRYRYENLNTDAQGVFSGTIWVLYAIDKVNQTPLLAIPLAPQAALLTNQPWNATFNPQTY